MENVANFVSKAHIGTFKAWYSLVESLGYNNFAQVLNATSYGIPQNRERIFLVSIRKDISDKYYFPEPFKLEKRFKDVLESNVDEKYYLSEKGVKYIANRLGVYCKIDGDISTTLTRTGFNNWTGSFVSEPFNALNGMARTIKKQYANVGVANMCRTDAFGASGVIETALPICLNSPTINTCGGGGREPKVVVGKVTSDNLLELVQAGLVRIRKITPREAFRLMDLEESDIDTLLSSGLANTSLYQLAGNSICVGVLYHLFRKMFVETDKESEQMTLF